MTRSQPMRSHGTSIRVHIIAGVAAIGLLFGGIGGWAATTELAGAVIAPGALVVESNVKKVQHPTGGVVGEIRVREGQAVEAGEILIRLDETQTRANLEIITHGLDELMARRARLEAERDGADEIAFPEELLAGAEDPDVKALMAGEEKLFASRRDSRSGETKQLGERIAQLRQQVEGLTAQAAAKAREGDAVAKELAGVRTLFEKKLTPLTRLTELERSAARLEGEHGQILSDIAQANGRIAEVELQILQIEQDLRSEVSAELSELRAKSAELAERKAAAVDQLKRLEIRSPQAGTVHQLDVHTVGGVIEPGEALMLIVPAADELAVEARVAPQEVDRIHLGQMVVLRFSSFNQRTTPEISGRLSHVAADVSHDQRTGLPHYTVRVEIPDEEITRLGEIRLMPGMPVETFIATDERTVLSYLAKPLSDQLTRAFRQE